MNFATRQTPGVLWVERAKDEAFRKALLDGVPKQLRSKMHEALSEVPDSGAMAHSMRYFGDELADIKNKIAPLLIELDRVLTVNYNLSGLFDWLNVTGFGNHYMLIKCLKAWSEFELSKPNG